MSAPAPLPGTRWAALASRQRVEVVQADAERVWYETLVTRAGQEPRRAAFYAVGRREFERRYREWRAGADGD